MYCKFLPAVYLQGLLIGSYDKVLLTGLHYFRYNSFYEDVAATQCCAIIAELSLLRRIEDEFPEMGDHYLIKDTNWNIGRRLKCAQITYYMHPILLEAASCMNLLNNLTAWIPTWPEECRKRSKVVTISFGTVNSITALWSTVKIHLQER